MANKIIIKRRDPMAEAAKATAEQRRIERQRREEMASGKLGGHYYDRLERVKEHRAKINQAKADRREAAERIFGG
jgi:hypothetical protein